MSQVARTWAQIQQVPQRSFDLRDIAAFLDDVESTRKLLAQASPRESTYGQGVGAM